MEQYSCTVGRTLRMQNREKSVLLWENFFKQSRKMINSKCKTCVWISGILYYLVCVEILLLLAHHLRCGNPLLLRFRLCPPVMQLHRGRGRGRATGGGGRPSVTKRWGQSGGWGRGRLAVYLSAPAPGQPGVRRAARPRSRPGGLQRAGRLNSLPDVCEGRRDTGDGLGRGGRGRGQPA